MKCRCTRHSFHYQRSRRNSLMCPSPLCQGGDGGTHVYLVTLSDKVLVWHACVNTFFKQLLLLNHFANFVETSQGCSLHKALSKLLKELNSMKNSGCHGNWKIKKILVTMYLLCVDREYTDPGGGGGSCGRGDNGWQARTQHRYHRLTPFVYIILPLFFKAE